MSWQRRRARRKRLAALRGKQVAGLEPTAYGGYKDVNEAWMAGALTIGTWPAAVEGPVAEHAAWRWLTDAARV